MLLASKAAAAAQPLSAGGLPGPMPVRPPGSALANLRILVAEDEWHIGSDMAEHLASSGAIVVGPVATLARALELALREPDLACAVLDLDLGGEAAWSVADALSERGVPVLLASGVNPRLASGRRADLPLLPKPFSMEELERAVEARIQGGRGPRAAAR